MAYSENIYRYSINVDQSSGSRGPIGWRRVWTPPGLQGDAMMVAVMGKYKYAVNGDHTIARWPIHSQNIVEYLFYIICCKT